MITFPTHITVISSGNSNNNSNNTTTSRTTTTDRTNNTTGSNGNNNDSNTRIIIDIQLTDEEDAVLSLLRDAATTAGPSSMAEQQCASQLPPRTIRTLRIAGGWVRDKILQLQTHDMDIVVDGTITGFQMATLVQNYYKQQYNNNNNNNNPNGDTTNQSKSSLLSSISSKIGVIQANPDQSKHLETATMRIGTIELDFNQLRGHEQYNNPNNRIPTIEITDDPYEDTIRRDFTCNTLYYNIFTNQIEDYTEYGYTDLIHTKLLRTPIDPMVTFLDDPLRIVRAIRFAVRYYLTIDPVIINAAQDPTIQLALSTKVSRERIGKELEGMLSGKYCHPCTAFHTIYQFTIMDCIFPFPNVPTIAESIVGSILLTTTDSSRNYEYNTKITSDNSERMEDNENNSTDDNKEYKRLRRIGWDVANELITIYEKDVQERFRQQLVELQNTISSIIIDERLVPLLLFLSPFRSLQYIEQRKNPNSQAVVREYSVIQYIIKESIKFTNKDVLVIATYMNTIDRMITLLQKAYRQYKQREQQSSDPDSSHVLLDRLEVGLLLRDTKETWVSCLIIATVLVLYQEQKEQDGAMDNTTTNNNNWSNSNIESFVTFSIKIMVYIINDLKLNDCWKMKPYLDGKELATTILPDLPKGPIIGIYLQEQIQWMIQNPNGTKEQCIQHLQHKYQNES